jgi:hypothetical protein
MLGSIDFVSVVQIVSANRSHGDVLSISVDGGNVRF